MKFKIYNEGTKILIDTLSNQIQYNLLEIAYKNFIDEIYQTGQKEQFYIISNKEVYQLSNRISI